MLALLLVTGLGGCTILPTPQNADEFKAHAGLSGSGEDKEVVVVDRSLSAVMASLTPIVRDCMNFSASTTMHSGTFFESRHGHAVLLPLSPGQYRLTHQVRSNPIGFTVGGDPPSTGMFFLVADFKALSPQTTEISTYYLGSRSTQKFVLNVARGQNVSCSDWG